jgi:hypothetical protein
MATPIAGPDPPAAGGEGGGPYIPAELIADIAKHLTSLNDIFALRAGCRAYRAALPLRRDLLAAQPPCLLVPHSSASPALPLFDLLDPGCPSFSLALFHLPQRRLHRFRARLPFARTGGVLTSDGTQVVAVDDATGEIIVTHLLSGAQVRLPKPPLPHDRLILTGGCLFAPATGRTDVQFCNNPWKNRHWTVASYGGDHEILDWRIINGVLYGFLPTCGLVTPSLSNKDNSNSMNLWLLGGEFDPQVLHAMQESTCPPLLGDCGGELLLIFKVGSIDPAYKIFRWDANEGMWAK